MKEMELQADMIEFLNTKTPRVYKVIPFMSRVIDIVSFDENSVIAYELKIKNWKKAIEQMLEHRIGAHYSYLCMPELSVSEKLEKIIIEKLSFYGFGLCLWYPDKKEMNIKLKAKKSEYLRKQTLEKLKNNIRDIYGSIEIKS